MNFSDLPNLIGSLSEIDCDLNATVDQDTYRSNCYGTHKSLENLCISLNDAVGKIFLFNSGGDTNPRGEPADIMFIGTFEKDENYGIVIRMLPPGVFWRAYEDKTLSQ